MLHKPEADSERDHTENGQKVSTMNVIVFK